MVIYPEDVDESNRGILLDDSSISGNWLAHSPCLEIVEADGGKEPFLSLRRRKFGFQTWIDPVINPMVGFRQKWSHTISSFFLLIANTC